MSGCRKPAETPSSGPFVSELDGIPTRSPSNGPFAGGRGGCWTDYGVGSDRAAPRMSLLPNVAGQVAMTAGGSIGLLV